MISVEVGEPGRPLHLPYSFSSSRATSRKELNCVMRSTRPRLETLVAPTLACVCRGLPHDGTPAQHQAALEPHLLVGFSKSFNRSINVNAEHAPRVPAVPTRSAGFVGISSKQNLCLRTFESVVHSPKHALRSQHRLVTRHARRRPRKHPQIREKPRLRCRRP